MSFDVRLEHGVCRRCLYRGLTPMECMNRYTKDTRMFIISNRKNKHVYIKYI